MGDKSIQLSIIIVNFKTPQLVVDCISSINQFESAKNFEIIVVDNDSKDESEKMVTARFPTVKWIPMPYNAGFARANNEGIKKAQADTFLLLNSDTIILDDAIGGSLAVFQSSDYLACGVQLLNTNRTPQISGNYFMTGGLNNLLSLPYVGKLVKGLGLLFKVKKPNIPDSNTETRVDWINGAYLMVKRKAVEMAGLMDEDFFLYAEEAEWCSRIRKHGELAIFGQYKVVHLQGESSGEAFGSTGKGYANLSDKRGLQIMLSNFLRIRKQYGIGWLLFHYLFFLITIPFFFIVGSIHSIFRPGLANSFFRYFRGFASNMWSVTQYLPRLISNRPYFYKLL